MSIDYTKTSKFLSLILRHNPDVIDITLDANGWCNIDELIKKMGQHGTLITREVLEDIVARDSKQRYSIDSISNMIRANQGHSIDVDLGLKEVEPPEVLFHGTVDKFISLIKQSGLCKMERQHVHLSKDIETANKVAQRRGKPVILTVKALSMHRNGYKFYISDNGVWLCDHVPPEYIEFQ